MRIVFFAAALIVGASSPQRATPGRRRHQRQSSSDWLGCASSSTAGPGPELQAARSRLPETSLRSRLLAICPIKREGLRASD